MRLKEQKLWDSFSRHGKQKLKLERVENVVLNGMPDVYAKRSGKWIELKAPIAPKKFETRVLGTEGLSQDQKNWHMEAFQCNRETYVLIRDSEKRLWLIEGKYADDINEWDAMELDDHNLSANWNGIIEELS